MKPGKRNETGETNPEASTPDLRFSSWNLTMTQSPPWPLERYRPLLHLYVRQLQLHPRFQRRFGVSDLVQETLLRAHAGRGQFQGQTEGELLAWLRTTLQRVAIDQVRKARADKCDLDLERSLQVELAASSARLERFLADSGPSPASDAANRELLLLVAEAISELPDDQREAVLLRDFYGEPVDRIADRLGKSERAVAGLLLRGRRRLRELLPDLR
jgi:RNA polymerase sigma-70 factor (ECF subfamily)